MSFSETVLLGALAGFTIFLGLGRLQLITARARVGLAMFSVGILVFLLVDVLKQAFEISERGVSALHAGRGSFGHAALLALLLVGGFALGSAGLGVLERRLRSRRPIAAPVAGGAVDVLTTGEQHRLLAQARAARTEALQTGVMIAIAIGCITSRRAWQSGSPPARGRSDWPPY